MKKSRIRQNTEKRMQEILTQEICIPDVVEDRLQQVYAALGQQREEREKQEEPLWAAASGQNQRQHGGQSQYRDSRSGEGRRSRRKKVRRLAAAAAIAAVVGTVSAIVLASGLFFQKEVVQEEDRLAYEFSVDYEMTPRRVYVTPEYVPEGYTEFEEGKYDADGMHTSGFSITSLNAYRLEAQAFLDTADLKSLEKTTLCGLEAHVLELGEQQNFDKRIYLFNEEEGYVILLSGGRDLSMKELKQIADHLKIELGEEVDSATVAAGMEKTDQEQDEAREAAQQAARAQGVRKEQVAGIGEPVQLYEQSEEDPEVTILGVKVLDSLAGYEKEYFYDYEGVISPWVEADGTLKSYERVTRDLATGEELARENVGQKVVEVTCQAVNNTASDITDFWAGGGKLEQLIPKEDGTFAYPDTRTASVSETPLFTQLDGAPVYFDRPQHTGSERNHFFYCDIPAGETLSWRLLYIVDEDVTGQMFLNYNLSAYYALDTFADIRQTDQVDE